MNESYPHRPQKYPHPRGCYRSAWGTWFVQLRWQGQRIYLGSCETMEEAIDLRDAFYAAQGSVDS